MTDTYGDSVASNYVQACGPITYIVRDNSTSSIPSWLTITDRDSKSKFINVQTNRTENIANYTMTLTGTLKNYPLQTFSLNFRLNVTEFKNGTVDGVAVKTGTAPFLRTTPPTKFNLVFGDPWVYSFQVLDADNDLVSTNVKLGVTSVFIQFDKGSNTFNIERNNTA